MHQPGILPASRTARKQSNALGLDDKAARLTWTPEEDQIILSFVAAHGPKWVEIARAAAGADRPRRAQPLPPPPVPRATRRRRRRPLRHLGLRRNLAGAPPHRPASPSKPPSPRARDPRAGPILFTPAATRLPGAPSAASGAGAAAAGVAAAVGSPRRRRRWRRALVARGAGGGGRAHPPPPSPRAPLGPTERPPTERPRPGDVDARHDDPDRLRHRRPLTARPSAFFPQAATTNSRVTTMRKECRPAAAAAAAAAARRPAVWRRARPRRRAPRAAAARRAAAAGSASAPQYAPAPAPQYTRQQTYASAGYTGASYQQATAPQATRTSRPLGAPVYQHAAAAAYGQAAGYDPHTSTRWRRAATRGGDARHRPAGVGRPAAMRGLNTLKSHHKCRRS